MQDVSKPEPRIQRRSAASYHEAMSQCPDARKTEFEIPLTLAEVREGEVLVDFPSGGAYLHAHVSALNAGVVYHAVEHVPGYTSRELEISQGDWHRLNFPDGSVDIVFSLAALHHLYPGRPAFYSECRRILRTGGRLVIGDVVEGTDAAAFLSEFVDVHSSEGHVARFLQRDLELPEIESSGFKVSHWELRTYPWQFPDSEAAVNYCRGLFRLDKATDDQIWDGLSHYLGIKLKPNGVELTWQLAFIRADRRARGV